MTDIHFGHLIREELRKQRRSVAWFAKEMSYTRGNMYKILERPHLHTDFILRACEKLQHDFLKMFLKCCISPLLPMPKRFEFVSKIDTTCINN